MKFFKHLPLLFIIILASYFYFYNYKNHPFFIDEYWFTMRSPFYDLFFIHHDTDNIRWYDPTSKEDASQPKVGPYLYGLTFHIAGITNIDTYFDSIGYRIKHVNNKPWWEYYWGLKLFNTSPEFTPVFNVIMKARITAILFTIGSIAMMYVLGTSTSNVITGVWAAFLLAVNKLIFQEGRHATTDSMQMLFVLICLWLYTKWLFLSNHNQRHNFYIVSGIIGMVTALAIGVKTSGVLLLFLLSILFIYSLGKKLYQRQNIIQLLLGTFIILITSFSIFYWLHPFIRHDTGNMLWKMFYVRTDEYKQYWSMFPGAAVTTKSRALLLIYKRTLAPNGTYVNFSNPIIPMDLMIGLAGLLLVFYNLYRNALAQKKYSLQIIAIWSGITFFGLIIYLKNDWPRYYIPFLSCLTLLQAHSLSYATSFVVRHLYKKFRVSRSY